MPQKGSLKNEKVPKLSMEKLTANTITITDLLPYEENEK